jgi:hypothetical protein
VRTILDGAHLGSGPASVTVDTSRLAPGTYCARLTAPDLEASARLVVVR